LLSTNTPAGLHEFVVGDVLPAFLKPGARALDLGAGSGAFATRLQSAGCDVMAVDRDFSRQIRGGPFDLVTAIEVFEHMESPIGFLRNVRELLAPGAVAVLTTPNVDNAPARKRLPPAR